MERLSNLEVKVTLIFRAGDSCALVNQARGPEFFQLQKQFSIRKKLHSTAENQTWDSWSDSSNVITESSVRTIHDFLT